MTNDESAWIIQPLLDAGYSTDDIRGIATWVSFEAIAADTEERKANFREIKSHMNAQQRAALDETVRRAQSRAAPGGTP